MSRITSTGTDKNGSIVYVAYGKDNTLGWFVDVWRDSQPTENGSTIEIFLECGDSDENHCWCKFKGLILDNNVRDKWGFGTQFRVALLQTLETNYVREEHEPYEHSYPDIVTVYDDEINDPISNMIVSKSTAFNNITVRDIESILADYNIKMGSYR